MAVKAYFWHKKLLVVKVWYICCSISSAWQTEDVTGHLSLANRRRHRSPQPGKQKISQVSSAWQTEDVTGLLSLANRRCHRSPQPGKQKMSQVSSAWQTEDVTGLLSLANRRYHRWVEDVSCVKSQQVIALLREWVSHLFHHSNQTFDMLSKDHLSTLCLLMVTCLLRHFLVHALNGCFKF